jgi:hypothetical protein
MVLQLDASLVRATMAKLGVKPKEITTIGLRDTALPQTNM